MKANDLITIPKPKPKRRVARKGDIIIGRSGTRYKLINDRGTLRRQTPKAESKRDRRQQAARKRKLANIRKAGG